MKLKNSIWLLVVVASLFGLNSCYDSKMDWNDPYDHIDREQLPLLVQEKISLYEDLLAYSDKIGVAIDFNTFMNDEAYADLVIKNFAQAVAGNEMKPGSLMNAAGQLNWGNTDTAIAALIDAGLSIYGHTLVWHQQAPAGYLNSLIAPETIPGEPGESLVDGTFEDGMGGWEPSFNAQNYTVEEGDKIDGEHALQVVVGEASGKYDAQLNSPAFSVVEGHHYQISFWIKANAPGKVGLDFGDWADTNTLMGNRWPNVNGSDLADVTTSWTQVVYNTETTGDPAAMIATGSVDNMRFRLLLGAVGNVTYKIDGIEVKDLDAATGPVNLLEGSFEGGLGSWEGKYNADNFTSIPVDDAIAGDNVLQVVVGESGSKYDTELDSPGFPVITGHHYQISFWIRGSIAGKVGLDFGDWAETNTLMGNRWPNVNGSDLADVGTGWTQVVYNTTTVGDPGMIATADHSGVRFRILLGATANCTYQIDDIQVIDLDAIPAPANTLPNGGFEDGEMGGWEGKYTAENFTIIEDDVLEGQYAMQVVVGESGTKYDTELDSPGFPIFTGNEYQISFWIKSSVPAQVGLDFGDWAESNTLLGNRWPNVNGAALADVGTSWTQVIYNNATVGGTGMIATGDHAGVRFRILLGATANCTYVIDDVQVVDLGVPEPVEPAASVAAQAGPITIEKTMEEKAAILESTLIKYITDVAGHYKGKVDAWEVLNEPMTGEGQVNLGVEDMKATNIFYWGYYLGKDYGVTAFKTAAAADPDAKLFINEFNLERISGKAKLQGLINYVEYIESNGGRVDGIGTQMHININDWDDTDEPTKDITKASIEEMFTALAATGKLIKVTELDIAIDASSYAGEGPGVDAPISLSVAQQEAQAKLFEFIANAYFTIIPEAQQYGITIWGVSDNPEQHRGWLPGDAPFLFDADYGRKWAYKGLIDGIMGEDVSASWTLGNLDGGDLPGMGSGE